MNRLAVINVVGLTEGLIGGYTPRIAAFAKQGSLAQIVPAFPAVTCTAQSNYLTGRLPESHGIVGNGWFNRELAEIQFWKQSNHLVQQPKIWDALRETDSGVTVANCFWWFNMYSGTDYSITPRPIYKADGGKIFDIYSSPYSIRDEIKNDLGEFPFFGFWGPAAGVKTHLGTPHCATRWIAESAKWIENKFTPTLNLIYLPHLDYNLQRHGVYSFDKGYLQKQMAESELSGVGRSKITGVINPAIGPDLAAIDSIVGNLIDFYGSRGVRIVLLSEYGLTNVDNPISLNRIFRKQNWLAVKEELGLEILDAGASKVFAVADHQIAHIYINDRSVERVVRAMLEKVHGVGAILDKRERKVMGIDHPRAGDLVVIADENAWFNYYYWLEDKRAPDFARTVDIHRKPGYDPVELFIDPNIRFSHLKIARRLLQKKLGFRMLMDVIPLNANLVKGSHGRLPENRKDWPVLICQQPKSLEASQLESQDVFHVLLKQITG